MGASLCVSFFGVITLQWAEYLQNRNYKRKNKRKTKENRWVERKKGSPIDGAKAVNQFRQSTKAAMLHPHPPNERFQFGGLLKVLRDVPALPLPC